MVHPISLQVRAVSGMGGKKQEREGGSAGVQVWTTLRQYQLLVLAMVGCISQKALP